ncbi:LLM class flavin-dependent oxidoreductase [Peribacillus simplex]|uniref:LLM class flavin-dependent oxidoreductase n=1 Tax=Peribacillus simplex TaxID=1478 RepID=UPI0010BF52F7|nr:LLM class flavin-dependent oxidoreductase [Peribacillus simplex]TKH03440.1 LLM class flavin-dependent oxidoreductase [Peribacillus simplex]
MSRFDVFKEAGNPMFNDNELKLGIFGPNVSNSCSMTLADTTFKPNFETNVKIAKMMENAGYECIVPVARWRGFGGASNFNGECMETYTWAAAMAAVTEKIYLFCTSHVPTVHPVAAAKMLSTIDGISKGRIGLNTVVGWFPKEMGMFNGKKMEHDTGYRYLNEWMDVVQKMWSEQFFDYKGEFFEVKDGWQSPKPVQSPRPVLISAGTSKAGRDFAARCVDFNFGYLESLDHGREWTNFMKKLAWDNYRREINTFTTSFVVCRPTEKEAKEFYNYYVREQGDWEVADIVCDMLGMQSDSNSVEWKIKARENFIGGWGGWPLVGTPEQVADQLIKMSKKTGVSGTLISFLDYMEEMPYFNENVLPMLEQAGVRNPVKKEQQPSKDSFISDTVASQEDLQETAVLLAPNK